jgi:catalase
MPHAQPRPAPQNPLAEDLLAGLEQVFGLHPGFRPVHAKGLMWRGTFAPTPAAAALSRAPHLNQPSTSVIVRLSDFAGVPSVPDNDLQAASPRGMAIRFYLGEHVHTDIVAHSIDGFPTRTGEEFLQFVRALAASGPAEPKPTPLEKFLAAHPAAMRFAVAPKPIPTSFARESFFGVSALKFTNRDGASRFGRYRIRPDAGAEYLTDDDAAKKQPDFLQDEFSARIARGPVKFHLFVQLAEPGDEVNDATSNWPDGRPEVQIGTISLTERADESDPETRKIIFDPIPRMDGLDPSDDPLWNLRADIYLLSGRRRRQASGQ